MPTFRSKNLRSGDLAEELGLLLLQSVALVAPVPRTEDVGIDAVITLLGNHDSYSFAASDSFFVQIKSASVETIAFEREQVSWLLDLELPFFVASVNRSAATVRLFCAHRLSDAFVTNAKRERLVIHLTEEPTAQPDEFVDRDVVDVYVGPPILTWSIENAHTKEFAKVFYDVCKQHVRIARESRETRRVGHVGYVRWTTNAVPELIGWKSVRSSLPGEDIEPIVDLLMPYFLALLDACHRANAPGWLLEIKSLIDKQLELVAMSGDVDRPASTVDGRVDAREFGEVHR